MKLLVLWIHVLGVVVWMGGLAYQSHVLLPAARRGAAAPFLDAVRRGRAAAWTALALVVLSGFENVTRLGPLAQVMDSGAGLLLAVKFMLVLVVVTLAAQRDFTQVPRLARAAGGPETMRVLRAITWLDRLTLLLGAAIVWLGLAISRR